MSDTENSRAGINPPVFFPSVIVVGLLVIFAASMPDFANKVFSAVQSWLIDTFGWLYLAAVGVYLIFCIVLALSRYGSFKLGPDHSEPDFSYISWFAMLFSAGMGIGLMFYGVAEPVMHYANPPTGDANTPMAAKDAMRITFFHWGVHAWAIYAVVGLALAYFHFRRDLPLRISSALYPFIGKRISGPIGNLVDVMAVFGTLFGVATSLGLGAQQVASGLNFLFSVPDNIGTQIVLICIITGMATTSVVFGLDGGIRRVSEFNLWLAAALLAFVIVLGPTLYIFQSLTQNIGNYVSSLVSMTFNSYVYTGNEDTQSFMSSWTLFYWSWWISWSPFVGMFVARVSRGRTIREFVGGVLLVPVGATFLWMTAFGDSALHMVLVNGATDMLDAVDANVSTALFVFLEQFPLTWVTSVLGTILVVTFFVTSSDSGSMVIDILTAKDGEEAPVWQRIFWAVSEGAVAIVLLLAGGIGALQAASLASALPFTIIILLMAAGLYKSLSVEAIKQDSMRHMMNTPSNVAASGGGNWERRLETLMSSPRRGQVERFLRDTVKPAMDEVAAKFQEESNLEVSVELQDDRCYIDVNHGAEIDFVYGVRARRFAAPSFAMGALRERKPRGGNIEESGKTKRDRSHYRAEVYLREGGQQYNVVGYTKAQLIGDILDQYEKHLHFLHLMR
ncbi:choline BCCT transporter BetT [Salinisphaera sp. Q1T1-3]|uniref:BCCT family transporter n=1 Tax=Salinisphaera sp. Q1T1-3 TaxID=2321229 RepID=UPI000E72E085|nr:choline BCCT transporter BetT [Salinisphaera sp. Q1T1-3]RJS92940.1 BCCT family transporter [Salinisphaera sp. Q1T1-3]